MAGKLGLKVLGEIKTEAERRATRKIVPKPARTDFQFSLEEVDRLHDNTSVIVARDGSLILKPANSGAQRGKPPRLLIPATPEAVDAMAAALKQLLADEERMAAKVESFNEWVNRNPQ